MRSDPGPSTTTSRNGEWTTETAEEVAASLGIRLTPLHWKVLGGAREECLRTGGFPGPCAIAEANGLSRTDLERLFPGPTCEILARISGCARATGERTGR